MFLSRKIYDDLRDSLVKSQVEANALIQVNAQLQAHIEWMRVRLTQLEFERAQLIRKYMGVDIPSPSFDMPENHPDPNQTIDFNDIGDAAAAALGLDWAADGTVFQNEKKA